MLCREYLIIFLYVETYSWILPLVIDFFTVNNKFYYRKYIDNGYLYIVEPKKNAGFTKCFVSLCFWAQQESMFLINIIK